MSSERQEDSENNPWWGEHIHRYQEAVKRIPKDSKILDIACGTGFGSNYLCDKNNIVVGGDLSFEAINYCKKKYNKNNLSFEIIDATSIPFQSNTFDAIVSFETIEHTVHFKKMLEEFKRIVKPTGVIIISTPNFEINSPNGLITNPYHTQEWNYEELVSLLDDADFKTEIYGQAYIRYKNLKLIEFRIAKLTENFFYLRGIRKFPIKLKDRFIKLLINKPMYPQANDYSMVANIDEIKKCKTFYAICTRR